MPKIRLYALVALPLTLGLAACSSGSSDTDVSPDPQVSAAPTVDTVKAGEPAGVVRQAPPADTVAVVAPDTANVAARDTANVAGYQAAAGMTHSLSLTSVNNSGFTGNAVLTDLGAGKTKVALTLTAPATADSTVDHDSHFHSGTCAAPGPITFELKDVRANGQAAESEVAAGMSTLMDGNSIVQVHADNSPSPIACAEVKKGM